MLVQCCVCGRFREQGRWVLSSPVLRSHEAISHGYCPKCAAKAFDDIRQCLKKHDFAPTSAVHV